MPPSILDRARGFVTLLLMAAGGAFVLAYLYVATSRLGYPYELEWMEGGMVDHVRRVLAGATLYPKPSIEFVSFLYPPLYYWAAAALAKFLGAGFLPLRLLSFLSSLCGLALLFAIVRRETGSASSGALAAFLFAATYDRVGGWFDIARLDSFYLVLLLASTYVLRFASSAWGATLAGATLGAAFLTKQSALVVAIPLVVHAALADWRRARWFAGTAALVMGGGYVALDRATGGWFHYYCFYLPSRHPRLDGGLSAFWTSDLLPALPIATAAAVLYAATRVRAENGPGRFFYPCLAAGMLGSSWSVRNMVGAEVNNLLPAFAAAALLTSLGWDELRRRADGSPTRLRQGLALAAGVLLLAQLGWLAYDPRTHLPSAADRAAGDRLVERLKAVDGDIFVPHHGYLARLAGKREFAHTLAMDNIYLDDDGPARRDLEAGMRSALAEKRFAAVLLESDGRYGVAILNSYHVQEALFESPDVFWPVTGGELRPEALCLPN